MIETEEEDGVWDEKKKTFVVFTFYAKKIAQSKAIPFHNIRQYLLQLPVNH